jgi:hypothetical protein
MNAPVVFCINFLIVRCLFLCAGQFAMLSALAGQILMLWPANICSGNTIFLRETERKYSTFVTLEKTAVPVSRMSNRL